MEHIDREDGGREPGEARARCGQMASGEADGRERPGEGVEALDGGLQDPVGAIGGGEAEGRPAARGIGVGEGVAMGRAGGLDEGDLGGEEAEPRRDQPGPPPRRPVEDRAMVGADQPAAREDGGVPGELVALARDGRPPGLGRDGGQGREPRRDGEDRPGREGAG